MKYESRRLMTYKFLLLLFILCFAFLSSGQLIREAVEFLTIEPNRRAVEEDSTLYLSKIIVSPVISYSPETSLGMGFGAKYLFKFKGSRAETRTSNVPLSFTYTLNNQFVFFSGFEVFTNQERYVIAGNIIYRRFPQLYYDVGRDTPESNEEEYSFQQLLIEPILLKRAIFRYLFLGGGIRINDISRVDVEEDGSLEDNNRTGERGSTSIGGEFALLYDSRDKILTASNGWYAEFTLGVYEESLGSTSNFRLTRLDLRHFFTPFKNRNDVLAFQFKTQFSNGDTPISELARLGSDEIMRGYYEGRFIDNHLIAFQAEYRKTIKGAVGLIVFAGMGDVANKVSDFDITRFRPSYGFGLRYLLDAKEDLNLRFDWGFGDNTNNFYLNISEAF